MTTKTIIEIGTSHHGGSILVNDHGVVLGDSRLRPLINDDHGEGYASAHRILFPPEAAEAGCADILDCWIVNRDGSIEQPCFEHRKYDREDQRKDDRAVAQKLFSLADDLETRRDQILDSGEGDPDCNVFDLEEQVVRCRIVADLLAGASLHGKAGELISESKGMLP